MKFSTPIFGVSLAFLLLLSGCGKKNDTTAKIPAVKVKTSALTTREFRRQIRVQGIIQPVNSAAIAARVSGSIDVLDVREGKKVKRGDILFQTDRKNLENHVASATQNLRVSKATVRTSQDDVTIAKTTLDKALLDYKRMQTLLQSNAVSQTAFEQAEADWKRATASYNRALTVLSFNQVKVEQAKTNLQIAEKNLADSIIRAPYDGVITERYHDAGEFIAAGTPVLKIEDQGNLEFSAKISGLYYPSVNLNTKIIISLNGEKLTECKLSYIAPSVEPLSRTFEIKAFLPDSKKLVSGMLCDVDIILAVERGQGIISSAVLPLAGGKSAVFIVENNIAKSLIVRPGIAFDGYTQIIDFPQLKNKKIIVQGQAFLNDNSPIEITGEK